MIQNFKESELKDAVKWSLLTAHERNPNLQEEALIKEAYEIICNECTFEKHLAKPKLVGNELKNTEFVYFSGMVGAVHNPYDTYRRIADVSVIPVKNPFNHKEDWNKFVISVLKLFPNVDAFSVGTLLNVLSRVIENIYANFDTEHPVDGAETRQVCLYQYSKLGGTGKTHVLASLKEFCQACKLPVSNVHLLGRWAGSEFSSNMVGLVSEFFPPKGQDHDESIVKINNIIDNEEYKVEYKGKDPYFLNSRITCFVNSNVLPFDDNSRRYGVVKYNEIPYSKISKEDKEKYFSKQDTNAIWKDIFESCPFGIGEGDFVDPVEKKSMSLNELIWAAKDVAEQQSYVRVTLTSCTIREFVKGYVQVKYDKEDPKLVKELVWKFTNDILKAVADGIIKPTQRVNGNLSYSKYNFQEISELTTSEDFVECNLNSIENPFEATQVAFKNFLKEETTPPTPPKKEIEESKEETTEDGVVEKTDIEKEVEDFYARLFDETTTTPVESKTFLKETNETLSTKEDHFFFKKDEYSKGSTNETSTFVISNKVSVEAVKKFQKGELPEITNPVDLATRGEYLEQNNFVFECDETSLEEQKAMIENLPEEVKKSIYWVAYSGSKSIHVVIHTNNKEKGSEYRKAIWEYINKEYFHGKGDSQCYNASRLTPNPNALRLRTNKPERNGVKQQCFYMNKTPAEYDVSSVVTKVRNERFKREQERELRRLIAPKFEGKKQELTVETLRKRRFSPARDNAISILEGTMSHGGDAVSGLKYMLKTGWDEYEVSAVVPRGTWSEKEFQGMLNAAMKD